MTLDQIEGLKVCSHPILHRASHTAHTLCTTVCIVRHCYRATVCKTQPCTYTTFRTLCKTPQYTGSAELLCGMQDPTVQCWTTEDEDDGDPPRLWAPDAMYPGTAFTRSLGDAGAPWQPPAFSILRGSALIHTWQLHPGICPRRVTHDEHLVLYAESAAGAAQRPRA